MPQMDLDAGALEFWGLESDPFSSQPLMFDNYNDYSKQVKTSTISAMNDLSRQLSKDTESKRIILKGNRGTGKTTAMRFLFKNLISNNSFKAIYCNILNLNDISVENAKLSIHSAILREIMEDFNSDEYLRTSLDFQAATEAIGLNNINFIDGYIIAAVNLIHKYYDKFFLFIDNIDKPAPERFSIFQDYFSTVQGFYEQILSVGPTYLFLPMQPFMIAKLEMSKQTEYLADKIIEVRNWTFEELDELLKKRLKLASKLSDDFIISKFFDNDARLALYTANDFIPRWVIKGTRKMLQRAYEISKEDPRIVCKPIKKDILGRLRESMKGAVGFAEFRKFDIINDIVISEHFEAYTTIQNCLKQNTGLAVELVEGLLLIWERRRYYDDRVKAILSNQNIIFLKEEGKLREDDKYSLEPKMKNLIDQLDEAFYNDTDSIRYYLVTSQM